jgi:hypothetical protein
MGYPSDLADAEWALIEHYFQPRDRRGSASLITVTLYHLHYFVLGLC